MGDHDSYSDSLYRIRGIAGGLPPIFSLEAMREEYNLFNLHDGNSVDGE